LLFSLTAAEIARALAELTLHDGAWAPLLPAYGHLILATIVVATSWVGWSVSEASLRLRVESVFSWPFFVLLTDVALVVFYFILVRGAEIPKANADVQPSARNECDMLALIFAGYFAWDVLTKAVIRDENSNAPMRFAQRFLGPTMWARGWISFVGMGLGLASWAWLWSATGPVAVLLADCSLLFLVLFFRALKEKRRREASGFGVLWLSVGLAARLVG
jgi:hypothetical protein